MNAATTSERVSHTLKWLWKSRLIDVVVGVATFTAAIVFAFEVASIQSATQKKPEALAVEPDVVDVGEVSRGSILTRSVTLQNNSENPLEIVDSQSTCSCAISNDVTGRLGPRAKRELRLRWDTTGKSGRSASSVLVRYRGSGDKDNARVATIQITGDIVD